MTSLPPPPPPPKSNGQTQTTPIEDIVYTSQQVGTMTLDVAKEYRNPSRRGLITTLPDLDAHLLPLRAGRLISVIGLASNFKSSLMMFLARKCSEQILSNEVVVYATWEQSVEEHTLFEIANAAKVSAFEIARGNITDTQWKSIQDAASSRQTMPIWVIGHSMQTRRKRPHLTMTTIANALRLMEDTYKVKPGIIFLDYLQRIESDTFGEDRRVAQMHIVSRAKDMALACGCPVVLGVQAKQDLLNDKWKLPGMYSAQETSNVAQTSDVILSVWMPKTTEQMPCMVGNPPVPVTDTLLILGLEKQKLGPANKIYYYETDPAKNEIYPTKTSTVSLATI